MPPSEFLARIRSDLARYPTITIQAGRIENLSGEDHAFAAELKDGSRVKAQKIILAHGVRDVLPDIPGLKDLWCHTVVHCPFCHGREFTGQAIGLYASNAMALHVLKYVYGLSKNLTLFTPDPSVFTPEDIAQLEKRGIRWIVQPITKVHAKGEQLTAVELEGGKQIPLDALFVTPSLPMTLSSTLGTRLGLKLTSMGLYEVGDRGISSVPGVYAAGDASYGAHSVVNALASGQMAGAGAGYALAEAEYYEP